MMICSMSDLRLATSVNVRVNATNRRSKLSSGAEKASAESIAVSSTIAPDLMVIGPGSEIFVKKKKEMWLVCALIVAS